MKAIVCRRYGAPSVFQCEEVPKPIPKDDEALVRVLATSLNAADFEMRRGTWSTRFSGPFRPMYKIMGTDYAGRIETVGRNVTHFQPGDEVWGDLSFPLSYGTFAEYVTVPDKALRRKPPNMSFETAAAIPTAAIVALQNLRAADPHSFSPILPAKGEIHPGEKVLINGAGGGVGTFAVQIAKSFGAEVTAVDNPLKLEMLREIGADHVIDYTREDFTQNGRQYDLVLDVVAKRSIFANKRALAPGGIFVYIGGTFSAVLQALILSPFVSKFGDARLGIVPWKPNDKEDLIKLEEMFSAGIITPVIDKTFPLEKIPQAFQYLEDGQAIGKIVITV